MYNNEQWRLKRIKHGIEIDIDIDIDKRKLMKLGKKVLVIKTCCDCVNGVLKADLFIYLFI